MRGFVSVLVLAAVIVVAGVWFLGPALAGTLVVGGLTAAGFSSSTRSVTVTADPPLELLVGRADAIAIVATGAGLGDLRAERLDLTLGDVRLLDRTYATVRGSMRSVTVTSGGNDLLLTSVAFSGPSSAATTEIRLPVDEVAAVIRAELRDALPLAPTKVELAEPSIVRIELAGQVLVAQLGVDGEGRVILEPAGGGLVRVVVFDPSGIPGLTIRAVSVVASEMVIEGLADVVRLVH
jgi:hypothetical protein